MFLLANPKVLFVSQRNSCEGNNRRRKELFCKIPCFEKKLKLRNYNAFFCISKDSFEIHFFFLKTTCVNSIFVNNSFVVIR